MWFRKDGACDSGSLPFGLTVFWSFCSHQTSQPANQPAVFERKLSVCESHPCWLFRCCCKEAVRPAGRLNHGFGTFIFSQDECAEVLHDLTFNISRFANCQAPALFTLLRPLEVSIVSPRRKQPTAWGFQQILEQHLARTDLPARGKSNHLQPHSQWQLLHWALFQKRSEGGEEEEWERSLSDPHRHIAAVSSQQIWVSASQRLLSGRFLDSV